ncbi:MAG: Phospholipid scramblase 3 [Caeruleum heppii]|nr:MAG: Phospholipid scramblase 3 [Caeruleum heppii]
MAERELGMGNMMARQWFRTHRSFTTHVFDKHENEVLRFHRPFSWISSRIRVYDPVDPASGAHSSSTDLQKVAPGVPSTEAGAPTANISPLALSDMQIIGESQQQWAPLRRKYNLFLAGSEPLPQHDMDNHQAIAMNGPAANSSQLAMTQGRSGSDTFNQFAYVDERFLSWDFSLLSADGRLIGSVNRNFAGFGREIFTDTGVYALRMDAAGLADEPRHLISQTGRQSGLDATRTGMTLDERAVMLATAVSVDFDYFSRKSGAGGMGFMPLWFPGMGGAAGAEAGAAEAGAVGAASEGGAVGNAARGAVGTGEGAIAGAGTMAGYEAMNRGRSQPAAESDPQSPQQPSNDSQGSPAEQDPWGQAPGDNDVWGNNDPWGTGQGGQGEPPADGGGGDGGGDSDWGDWF